MVVIQIQHTKLELGNRQAASSRTLMQCEAAVPVHSLDASLQTLSSHPQSNACEWW